MHMNAHAHACAAPSIALAGTNISSPRTRRHSSLGLESWTSHSISHSLSPCLLLASLPSLPPCLPSSLLSSFSSTLPLPTPFLSVSLFPPPSCLPPPFLPSFHLSLAYGINGTSHPSHARRCSTLAEPKPSCLVFGSAKKAPRESQLYRRHKTIRLYITATQHQCDLGWRIKKNLEWIKNKFRLNRSKKIEKGSKTNLRLGDLLQKTARLLGIADQKKI